MSIQPPSLFCQPWTGLISSGSSPFSFLGLLHISSKHIFLKDSNVEQSNIVQRVHILQRLTNKNAKFGSLLHPIGKYSGNTLSLIYLRHSCYILSTFEVHSKYSNCILFVFLDARTVFGSHSGIILTPFVQHSRHLPARLQARYSGSNRTAFIWHSKYIQNILNVMTAF